MGAILLATTAEKGQMHTTGTVPWHYGKEGETNCCEPIGTVLSTIFRLTVRRIVRP